MGQVLAHCGARWHLCLVGACLSVLKLGCHLDFLFKVAVAVVLFHWLLRPEMSIEVLIYARMMNFTSADVSSRLLNELVLHILIVVGLVIEVWEKLWELVCLLKSLKFEFINGFELNTIKI